MRTEVAFTSKGETIRALFYTPDNGSGPFPAVVMAGGWCYVKELVQPDYAKYIVDAGFAALIFDYRRLGASEGQPRQHIDPFDQVEDYKNAISYLLTRDDVDSEHIGIWGISYSGGHVLIVGASDPRVKCIVSNIPVVDGWDTMRRVHGGIGFRRLQNALAEDRARRFATGVSGYMPMSGEPTELVTWPFPEVKEIFQKLKETEAPAHEHRNTVESVELLLDYNVFPYARRILNTPTLMIVAENDDITLWDREIEVYNTLPSAQKKLIVLGQTSHMTLYSNKSRLQVAAEAAAAWFSEHLLADIEPPVPQLAVTGSR